MFMNDKNNITFNIVLNFFSKINNRKIHIDGKDFSLSGDLIKNELTINKNYKKIKKKFGIIDTYYIQNKKILSRRYKNLCNLNEGLITLKLIKKIKFNAKKIKIPLSEPSFFGNEKKELIKCLEKKWISASGFQVKNFENKIRKLIKAKYVLGIINCTASLQLAIKILKPKENDEVLVPSITFIATVNSVLYNNCKPVFIDCDRSLLIDIKK